jgi:serine-type D-Ala-D-Ala carboxypeptidase/endopeptidase (penicillin-binding protein 4)
MSRVRLLTAVLVVTVLAAVSATSTDASRPSLETALSRALVAPGLNETRTGAFAVDLDSGEIVYRENADRALLPASVEKLAVALSALRILGPDHRFQTDLMGTGTRTGHTWDGNLVLVGHGDPTLATADLERIARHLARWGIDHVEGRVLGDETYFDTRRDAPGWKPSYLGIESRPLSALAVVDLPVRTPNGSAAIAAHALTAALRRYGVTVSGPPGKGRASDAAQLLARDRSGPLRLVVRHMDRESDNFVAETLLKDLGAMVSVPATTAGGAFVARQELVAAEVPLDGVRIVDGSGLSLQDRLTVRALVAILRAGAADPAIGDAFMTSLSVAGVSGTLEHRLDRRPTRGQVVGKTGTTNAACALAGFVRHRYVFAIVQNGSPVPYWTARVAQDRFVTVLARS